MPTVEDFLVQWEGPPREIMQYFHELLTHELNLTGKIRYKIPFYYGKSWICYLNPSKTGKVELALVRGNELFNEQGLLNHKGRKQVYSMEFERLTEIPLQSIMDILQEAIWLDETLPYPSKRQSK